MNEPTQDPPPKARLSADSLAKLRTALQLWVSHGASSDVVLRDALHAIAAEARQRGIRAEELLVTLKTTWFELGGGPASSSPSVPPDQKRLDELVTACIKAYYA